MIIPELPIYLVSNDLRTGATVQGFLVGEDVGESAEYYCYAAQNKMYMLARVTLAGSVRVTKYFFGRDFSASDWEGRAGKTYDYPQNLGA